MIFVHRSVILAYVHKSEIKALKLLKRLWERQR